MLLDLNADLGEGAGFDADLMRLVTSANVCCGAHAGSAFVRPSYPGGVAPARVPNASLWNPSGVRRRGTGVPGVRLAPLGDAGLCCVTPPA